VLTKAVATKMIDAGGKRNTATKAARGSDKSKVGKAVGAEERRPRRFQSPLATQTQRGKQQIL